MKVLIAVDDDAPSREALAFAERMVSDRDEVVVLNVTSYAELVPFTGDPFGAGIGAVALDPTSLAELDDRAEQLVERTAGEIDAKKTDVVVEHGSPGERICATAAEHGIELIILGSHERGAFGRFMHGSVSDYVVHHAPCPVLVVRHTAAPTKA
ncbi:MAG: universal stress protein [Acidimicrobiales bacterium]